MVEALRAGGWLPYTLRIKFRTVESHYPYGFKMKAHGDLEGTGAAPRRKRKRK